jgi:hypothetical protein
MHNSLPKIRLIILTRVKKYYRPRQLLYDRTVEIAHSLGAQVVKNRFVNHARQFQ